MNGTLYKTKHFAQNHKIISTIIAIVIVFIGYKIIKASTNSSGETRYIIGSVERGTIVSTVTGTGQIAASNQVDLKSKTSGSVTSINVTNGQEVKAGTIIASLDASDAEVNLETARLSLQKLTQPADQVTLLQTQNALESAKQANAKAAMDLQKAYDDAFISVGSSFIDLPDVVTGLSNLFGGSQGLGTLSPDRVREYGTYAISLRDTAEASYFAAKTKYNKAQALYTTTTQKSSGDTVEALALSTYDAVKSITQALKDAKTAVDFVKDQSVNAPDVQTAESNLSTWTSKVSTHLQDLSSITNTITTSQNSIQNSAQDLAEKTASLEKLQSGADPLDIRTQELSIQQKEQAYEDTLIRAPFDGIVAKVNIKSTDDVSSGTSVATFISKQQVANISLNEVEVAKLKIGQNATLTFDAIDGLSITGKVSDIDLVGTVTQGVVVYNVQILLDTQDPRIKPGMTVSAAIATDVHQDVLTVPNSAIKTQGGSSFVEVVDRSTPVTNGNTGVTLSTAPVQTPVEIGIADDLSTEIISGVSEGDKVVTRTITGTATKPTTSSAPTILNAAGVRGGATPARGGFQRGG